MKNQSMEIFVAKELQNYIPSIKNSIPESTVKQTTLRNWKKISIISPSLFIFPSNIYLEYFHLQTNAIGLATFFLEEDIEWLPENIDEQQLIQKIKYKSCLWNQYIMKKEFQDECVDLQELAAIGKISLDLIHEINNPLQIILGFTENIVESITEEDTFHQDIKIIEEEVFRCIQTIKKARGFHSYLEESLYQDLSFFINGIHDMLTLALRKKRITLDIQIPSQISLIAEENSKLGMILLCTLVQSIEICAEKQDIFIRAEEEEKSINLKIKISLSPKNTLLKRIHSLKNYLTQHKIIFEYFQEKQSITYLLKFRK